MRRFIAAGLVASLLMSVTGIAVHAMAPPPPPPPNCPKCPGPPPPPTPVPTVAPTVVPAQSVVDVHLASPKVSRGQIQKVSVDASTDDAVTIQLRYKSGKASTYHAKVGGSGTTVTKWMVPKTAPVGKAVVIVNVKGATTFNKTISFLVTK